MLDVNNKNLYVNKEVGLWLKNNIDEGKYYKVRMDIWVYTNPGFRLIQTDLIKDDYYTITHPGTGLKVYYTDYEGACFKDLEIIESQYLPGKLIIRSK